MEVTTARGGLEGRRGGWGSGRGARRLCLLGALALLTLLAGLAGSVRAAQSPGALSGEVTDAVSHAPVDGVEVCAANAELLAEEEEEEGRAFGCARTDALGQYTISQLAPEEGWDVVFAAPVPSKLNYITQYYDGKVPPAEPDLVAVASGKTTPGVDAALLPGAQISGRVTDASTGEPIEGVAVCAFRTGANGSLEVTSYAYTGASGAYAVAGLPSGSYGVVFVSQGYVVQYYKGQPAPAQAAAVAVSAPQSTSGIDATLATGSTVFPPLTFAPSSGTPPGATPIGITLGPLLPDDVLVPITPIVLSVTQGTLSLAGTRVAVLRNGVALVRVDCAGAVACRARITLRIERKVVIKGKRLRRTSVVGKSAALTIAAGRKATVRIKLDSAARSMLNAAQGRLDVDLALVVPSGRIDKSVVLTAQSARG